MHSNIPLCYGAFSKLNLHLMWNLKKYLFTSVQSIVVCRIVAADMNVITFSHFLIEGTPLLAVKYLMSLSKVVVIKLKVSPYCLYMAHKSRRLYSTDLISRHLCCFGLRGQVSIKTGLLSCNCYFQGIVFIRSNIINNSRNRW